MKKLLLAFTCLFFWGGIRIGMAQAKPEQKTEFEKQISIANQEFSAKQYFSALKAMNKAKNEVQKHLDEELSKAFSTKSNEWVLSYSADDEKSVVNSLTPSPDLYVRVRTYTSGSAVPSKDKPTQKPITPIDPSKNSGNDNATTAYEKKSELPPKITATISNCREYSYQLEKVYNPSKDDPMQVEMPALIDVWVDTTLTIQNNPALLHFSAESKTGDLTIGIGYNTVRLVGTNISDYAVLTNMAKEINFDILKKVLQ